MTGTLGTTNLNNVSFVFTFIGNGDPFENTALSNTITIGSSKGSFTGSVEAGDIDASSSLIGFSNTGIAFLNSVAATYNLAGAVGPLTSTSSYYAGGSFTITSAQDLSLKATTSGPWPAPCIISWHGSFMPVSML